MEKRLHNIFWTTKSTGHGGMMEKNTQLFFVSEISIYLGYYYILMISRWFKT